MQDDTAPRSPDVLFPWYEAAALVQLVADAIAGGRLSGVPPVACLTIDDDGDVQVLAGSSGWPAFRGGGSAPPALRALFRELVGPSSIPAALEAALEEGSESAEAFSRAIGAFVRPSREGERHALADRLRRFNDETRLQGEIDAITRKARSAERAAPGEPPQIPPPPRRRVKSWMVLGAAVACAVFSTLLVVVGSRGGTANAESPAIDVLAHGKELLAGVRAAGRSLLGAAGPAHETAAPAVAPAPPDGQRPRGRARVAPPASTPVHIADVSLAAALGGILPGPGELVPQMRLAATIAPPDAETLATADTLAMYDASDASVHPPLLVRPRLPSEPPAGTSLDEVTRLEVIVAPSGKVERVRLLATSTARRYYDTMLLSAVKAWVFTPAYRDGVPVRYRLEIPLTS